ncbi:hypothetical protein DFJ73DRAFT_829196 [Zopfochytrium polystomum]|nr:hypothetical protein DFJ73DRAFT_829196 [Zopfochytrium polystomum]
MRSKQIFSQSPTIWSLLLRFGSTLIVIPPLLSLRSLLSYEVKTNLCQPHINLNVRFARVCLWSSIARTHLLTHFSSGFLPYDMRSKQIFCQGDRISFPLQRFGVDPHFVVSFVSISVDLRDLRDLS